jgi:hypothetical protein
MHRLLKPKCRVRFLSHYIALYSGLPNFVVMKHVYCVQWRTGTYCVCLLSYIRSHINLREVLKKVLHISFRHLCIVGEKNPVRNPTNLNVQYLSISCQLPPSTVHIHSYEYCTLPRRKTRVIESNAKCGYLKKLTCKGNFRQVFYLSEAPFPPKTPYSPPHREGGGGG